MNAAMPAIIDMAITVIVHVALVVDNNCCNSVIVTIARILATIIVIILSVKLAEYAADASSQEYY